MTTLNCSACGQTKSIDEFYPSHPTRCKACMKEDSRRNYLRKREQLKEDYAVNADEHRAFARMNYQANRERILLQARLRYRKNKARQTIEDEAIATELEAILDGDKKQPTSCAWCAEESQRLDPHWQADTDKVFWLCGRCLSEVRSERRAKGRKQRKAKKKPRVPRWLRQLLGH